AVVAALTADRPAPSSPGWGSGDLGGGGAALESDEDTEFGGFGSAPTFPVTPVLTFLLELGRPGPSGQQAARALAERTLASMAASPLRDPVEGGFFRYAVQRDWSEPHYERMLSDNAQLLAAYAAVGDRGTAEGV